MQKKKSNHQILHHSTTTAYNYNNAIADHDIATLGDDRMKSVLASSSGRGAGRGKVNLHFP